MHKTQRVFGVSTEIVESYIEREQVDGAFLNALELSRQIVVYGSSKQGKTALYRKHLKPESILLYQCSPTAELKDIYSSIARQSGAQILSLSAETKTDSGTISSTITAKVKIFLEAGGDVTSSTGGETGITKEYKTLDYNLAVAQDLAELLKGINFNKYIILDNFHYLTEEVQKNFSFDLRIFQDLGIRFVILGIWRERNRLNQFNGDLQDRIVEVAVEPWEKTDFQKVIKKGSELLNVDLSGIENELIASSFDSIGVLQELCNRSCLNAGVMETSLRKVMISEQNLTDAISNKLNDYSSRHLRSFESFADSITRSKDGLIPLYIPYYFLRVLVNSDFDKIVKGFKKNDLQQEIAKIHHRGDNVRATDMSNFLNNITKYQVKKDIRPPLFDYDRSISTIKIIDSTLYFFLRNCDKSEVLEIIGYPEELKPHSEPVKNNGVVVTNVQMPKEQP